MARFQEIVEKFQKAVEDIRQTGTDLAEQYPNSKKLIEMADEIKVATESLDYMKDLLADILEKAEIDQDLFRTMLSEMKDSDVYKELSEGEREKLAQQLTLAKQPLADRAKLEVYAEKALAQKPTQELLGMFPKAQVIERGKKLNPDRDDAFDFYQAGMDSLKKDIALDKGKIAKELTKVWLKQGMGAIVREFYSKYLKESSDGR